MNIMKQYAMDDKIIEGCKTCEKQISQQEKRYAHRSQNTHTKKNKSNQFYISKTSQDNLVSIH